MAIGMNAFILLPISFILVTSVLSLEFCQLWKKSRKTSNEQIDGRMR